MLPGAPHGARASSSSPPPAPHLGILLQPKVSSPQPHIALRPPRFQPDHLLGIPYSLAEPFKGCQRSGAVAVVHLIAAVQSQAARQAAGMMCRQRAHALRVRGQARIFNFERAANQELCRAHMLMRPSTKKSPKTTVAPATIGPTQPVSPRPGSTQTCGVEGFAVPGVQLYALGEVLHRRIVVPSGECLVPPLLLCCRCCLGGSSIC